MGQAMRISSEMTAVVAGGASGLGAAAAGALAAAGARVTIFDRDAAKGAARASEIGAGFAEVDVSNPASVAEGLKDVGDPLRMLVNCAGVAPGAKTVSRGEPHDADLFAKTITVNLVGSFNCASQAAARMAATDPVGPDGERGLIVHTASVAAYDGQVGQIAYAASKGGIVGMTLPMARDLADKGVRVVSIAPGLFRTPLLEGLSQEVRDSLGKQVPFPSRLGDPEEFAGLVMHIVENRMLNGEVVRLDGAIRMAPR